MSRPDPEDPLAALLRQYRPPPDIPEAAIWERVRAERRARAAAPRRRPAAPWKRRAPLALAAGVLLALALTASVSPLRAWAREAVATPVRAWTAQRLTALARLAHPEAAAPEPDPAATAPWHTGGALRVSARAAGTLVVRIDQCQAEGTLEVWPRQGTPEVSLELVRGASSRERLSALPGELRVHNQSGSRASYRLVVPASLSPVWLHIGAARPVRLPHPPTERIRWQLDLRDGRRAQGAHCREDAP
jgi:hypothetical protein